MFWYNMVDLKLVMLNPSHRYTHSHKFDCVYLKHSSGCLFQIYVVVCFSLVPRLGVWSVNKNSQLSQNSQILGFYH